MQPPVWPQCPEAGRFADLYAKAPISAIEAARANAQALAVMLKEAGINVNCLPLLDVRQEGAHDIIGDRALGAEPMQVAALGRAVRSEEHTSELQSLMRISYAVFCLKKKKIY